MFRIPHRLRLVPFLIAGLACSLPQVAQAQQLSASQGTGSGTTGTTTSTSGTQSGTGTTQGSSAAQSFSIDQPALTTDINQLMQDMQSGFIGTGNADTSQFLGVAGAGQNASNQTRQFTTRTPGQNVNQGTQTQPIYRTFGPNNTPYRSPHKIAFEVQRPRNRSIDLNLRQKVQTLNSRRPQFRNVEFVVSTANTVTLRGSVETERDLKMAMLFVKMEPGVNNVINELQVTSVTPAPLTPASE